MNKKIVIPSLLVVGIITAGIIYLSLNSSEPTTVKKVNQDSSVASQTPSAPEQSTETTKPGSYVDYNEGVIASTSGTKLLFFHASWCPQCRDIEADIQKKGVPSNVTIIKVNYDASQSLRKKYGVTQQTTIVKVDDSGNLVKKFVAYDSPNLDSVIQNTL